MTRGHLYIAFSKPYERTGAYSVKALRRYSDLPVHVLTDIPARDRDELWYELNGVTFTHFPDSTDLTNRQVKTMLHNYTPFDQTLYTDVDTAIMSPDFKQAFDIVDKCDIAFPYYEGSASRNRIATAVYQRAVEAFGLRPIENILWVYQGGVCVFNRNDNVRRFFEAWNEKWRVFKFRDMPSLMATVHTVENVSVGLLPHGFGFPDSKIIQHFYGWKPPKTSLIPPFPKLAPDERSMRWKWDKSLKRWRT